MNAKKFTHYSLLGMLLLLTGPSLWAQHQVTLEKGKTISVNGDLTEGNTIPLSWAANSNVACFPATRFMEFEGNHVFYMLELPRYSRLKITVTPDDRKHRINVYGFSGHDGSSLPPDISRVVSCEAGYEIHTGNPNLNRSAGPQSIELMAINNPYKVLVGVAGAKGVTEGSYTLSFELSSR